MNTTGREQLAAAVVQRRGELGLAQGDLKSRGGPGVVTVGNVERCDDPVPSRGTLAALDRALEWAPGSAAKILAGGSVGPSRESADFVASGGGGPRLLSDYSLAELADEIRRRADEGS